MDSVLSHALQESATSPHERENHPSGFAAFGPRVNLIPDPGRYLDTLRRILYFHSHDITGHLIVIAIYAVAGAIVAIQASRLWQRRGVPGDAFDKVS